MLASRAVSRYGARMTQNAISTARFDVCAVGNAIVDVLTAKCVSALRHTGLKRLVIAGGVGANSQLQVVPYYNKPTQEGQYLHFKAIAEAVDLPMVLYNVPGRSVADMAHDTVLRLARVPGIVGIKEATGNIERAQWLIHEAPAEFSIYSGDDPTAVALMLCGGHGNVSVTANIAPKLMHEMCLAAIAGQAQQAMAIQRQLLSLHKNMFTESNPIPVKWAAQRMGLCGPTLRLPMTPLSSHLQPALENAMRSCGVI